MSSPGYRQVGGWVVGGSNTDKDTMTWETQRDDEWELYLLPCWGPERMTVTKQRERTRERERMEDM